MVGLILLVPLVKWLDLLSHWRPWLRSAPVWRNEVCACYQCKETFICQPALIQTVAAPAPCLIGLSPVELGLSDMSAISAAGAQAGVNPVSSATIIY